MKHVFSFFLLSILLALCGCQYSIDIAGREEEVGAEALLSDDTDTEVDYAMDDGTTIAEETIVNSDGAVIRLLGITNSLETPQLQLVFERGNREYIDFIIDYVKINGWQVSGEAFPYEGLSIQSFSRYYKEFTGTINISTTPLVECGLLDRIYEIEFGYQLVGTWREDVIAEGVYTTTTSNSGETIEFACDGPTLIETDGIKIQLYSFEHGTYLDENCENLTLYVENNSDREIEVVIDDAEKYDGTISDESEEEKEKTEKNVISRSEKDGKLMTPVPLYGDSYICAESRTLGMLQTADFYDVVTLSEGEVLSFTLSVYDYEEYNSSDSRDESKPLVESTVELTEEDFLSPG